MLHDEFTVMHPRAAGIDVHKMQLTASVRIHQPDGDALVATETFVALPSGRAALVAWCQTTDFLYTSATHFLYVFKVTRSIRHWRVVRSVATGSSPMAGRRYRRVAASLARLKFLTHWHGHLCPWDLRRASGAAGITPA